MGMNWKELAPFVSIEALVQSAERVLHVDVSMEQPESSTTIVLKGRGSIKGTSIAPEDGTSPLSFPLSESSLRKLQLRAQQLSLTAENSALCASVGQLLDVLQQWRQDATAFCRVAIADVIERHSQAHERLLSLSPQILKLLSNSLADASDAETQSAQMATLMQLDPQLSFALHEAVATFPFLHGLLPVGVSTIAASTSTLRSVDGDLLWVAQQLQSLDLVRVVLSLSRAAEEDFTSESEEDGDNDSAELTTNESAMNEAEDNHIIRPLAVVGGTLRHLFVARDTSTQVTSWADLNVSVICRLQRDTESLVESLREFAGAGISDKQSEEMTKSRWQNSVLQLCFMHHHQSEQLSVSKETHPDQDGLDVWGDEEEVVFEPKSTRLSQGIAKRKADSEFADSSKIHLHYPSTATIVSSPGVAPAPSNATTLIQHSNATKRRKGNKAAAVIPETSNEAVTDPVLSAVADKRFTPSDNILGARQSEARTLRWLLRSNDGDQHDDEMSPGWALIELCRSLDTRMAVRHVCSNGLLMVLLQAAQFWQLVLRALVARLRETHKWNSELTQLYALKAKDTAHHQRARLGAHLSLAMARGFLCLERFDLERKLQEADEWLRRARGMLAKDKSLFVDLDDLKAFIKKGETLVLDATTELTALKSEQRRARHWKSRCDAFQATDSSDRSQEELAQLTIDAESICVDLRSDLDAISADSRTYCLCRQFYFGDMVGCDNCDDWYHYSCANLSANQVAKCEQYTCVRCAMKSSLAVGVSVARQICAKWQNAELHFEERMNQIYKVCLLMSARCSFFMNDVLTM